MTLEADARIVITSADTSLPGGFGRGTALLLEGVERTHSLNKAAKELGMAYSKAWRIVKEAEAVLGVDLLLRDGARGSTLTDAGKQALSEYRKLEREVNELLANKLPNFENLK